MTSMRILITGGAGCLGSNLIEYWLPQGHEIFVIDNFATGKREVLPPIAGLTVVEGSIANAELVINCFEQFQPTHVIHSAAAYKNPHDWIEDTATNVLGTINVAQASLTHEVKRFVNFQTALCYGRPNQVPIPVNHPTAPFTSYGISKTAGESYLMHSGLPIVSLRLANICGPRLAIGPIPTFYKRLKAEQNCFCSDTVRDFIDMSDFLLLIDKVVSDSTVNGVFNVSTGEGYSIKDVFETVAQYLMITPPNVPIMPVGADDVPTVVLDPSQTEQMFGWKAQVSFPEIINRQLSWYDAHGVTDIYSHLVTPKS
ncbi:NAD-dependent epimerase/dehydratase family protein [Laspinema olomoucense]|uniref:NAD-dependent epimerase/dehydratase family protein n=1 Tax=Laspinema olomoucense TaxID=3231600 RepID=UPI0021BAF4A1|nr:NAD-dependent epimerase/dehydratase family protein [Laspinema sp. D3d]MCT7974893.1 NAD-dependent epimerase/dehydratase family protein [Laspinema sp. D3d]